VAGVVISCRTEVGLAETRGTATNIMSVTNRLIFFFTRSLLPGNPASLTGIFLPCRDCGFATRATFIAATRSRNLLRSCETPPDFSGFALKMKIHYKASLCKSMS
jgi:hypothetical protein